MASSSASVFKPAGLSDKTAKAAVSKALIQGTGISDQFDAMSKSAQKKFTATVLTSIQSGETLAQMAARMSGGTVAGEAVPGFLKVTRQQSIALSHTAVTAVSKQDRLEAFRANSDVISAIQQISTLDNRTTDICISYSDLTWDVNTLEPIGHSLPWAGGPPRHFNCRSVIVPVVKSPAQLGVKTRAKIPDEVRATMDGQKSSSLTFSDWLKGKSENFQNEVLGVKKAKLFREGKLALQDLINFNANNLPVKALKTTAKVATNTLSVMQRRDIDDNLPKPSPKAPSQQDFMAKVKAGKKDKAESEAAVKNLHAALTTTHADRKHVVSQLMLDRMPSTSISQGRTGTNVFGVYHPGTHKITISSLSKDRVRGYYTTTHEFGHHIHMGLLGGRKTGKITIIDKLPGGTEARDRLVAHYKKVVKEYRTKTAQLIGDKDLFGDGYGVTNQIYGGDIDIVAKNFSKAPDDYGITAYAHTNEEEWFAESWAYYFGDPEMTETLKIQAPETFKFIEALLKEYGG